MLNGQIGVGQGLGLHPLGGVHHQDRPLAGGQGAGDLIVKVHVARGVNEVQSIGLAVQGIDTGCVTARALMVMPRSRSRSMLSSS